MKLANLIFTFCILFFLSSTFFVHSQLVMSYNIKYDNVRDTVNNWNDRKQAMVGLLKEHQPSFIGMQEVLFNQLDYLDNALVDYNYIGVGRDDGKQKGEFSPILFNTGEYKLLQQNTFWLSKTPDKVSVGWDAALERICTYGLFENIKTRKRLWVFNTHFDHRGVKARKKAAKLILRKIQELNKEKLPMILMGDFNLRPEEKPIQYIQRKMNDGFLVTSSPFQGPIGTFNGFDLSSAIDRRIDYIFVKGAKVESHLHLDKRLENGKHISDHQPVLTSIKMH